MTPAELREEVARITEDLRLWRKTGSANWHSDPLYHQQAVRLARLERQLESRNATG